MRFITSLALLFALAGQLVAPALAVESGSANQVLRVPSGGGLPKFGQVDLSQSAAVTGTLPVTRGGTGTTTSTGTGSTVLSASPTLTGTLSGATGSFSANVTAAAFVSGSTNPATAGIGRFANANALNWRNAANSGNIGFTLNSSDVFAFDGSLSTAGGVTSTGIINANGGMTFASASSLSASAGRFGYNSDVGLFAMAKGGNDYDLTFLSAAGNYLLRNPTGTNSLEMAISAGGNVGIGGAANISAASSSHKVLTVQGAANPGVLELARQGTASSGADVAQIDMLNGSNLNVRLLAEADAAALDSGRYSVWTRPTTGSLTERFRINSSGNVVVGTGSATLARFHVYAADSEGIRISAPDTTSTNYLQFGSSASGNRGNVTYNHSTDTMTLATAGTDRVTITSSSAAFAQPISATSSTNPYLALTATTGSKTGYVQISSGDMNVAAPAGNKVILSSSGVTQPVLISGTGATSYLAFTDTATSSATRVQIGSSGNNFQINMNGNLALDASTTGKIGLGAASSGTVLDVNGDFSTRPSTNSTTSTPQNALSSSSVSWIRMTGAATITINCIDNVFDGKRVVISNVTGNNLTLAHNASGSCTGTAKPIFNTGSASLVVAVNGSVEVIYDATSTAWRSLKP
jgi:hypothetical protein